MNISFIGGGNMAEVMVSAILDKGISSPEAIFVSDVSDARRQYLEKYRISVSSDNRQVVGKGEVVILAVKPQNLADVMAGLKGHLKPEQLVLSIIAGARLETLCQGLSHRAVVRSMPNTPARIGEGMTVWTASSVVTDEQKKKACSILGSMGKEIYVADEKYIDMATAISGSGPAYVFLFIESLVDAAVHIGIPEEMAMKLVLQTLLGAGHFLQKADRTPAELREMVTSRGGTTEAALRQFEEGGFRQLALKAVVAAYERAKQLGR